MLAMGAWSWLGIPVNISDESGQQLPQATEASEATESLTSSSHLSRIQHPALSSWFAGSCTESANPFECRSSIQLRLRLPGFSPQLFPLSPQTISCGCWSLAGASDFNPTATSAAQGVPRPNCYEVHSASSEGAAGASHRQQFQPQVAAAPQASGSSRSEGSTSSVPFAMQGREALHPADAATPPPDTTARSQQPRQALMQTVKLLLAGGLAGAISKTATAPLARLTILYQVCLLRVHKP